MAEPFRELRERLLRAGVAPRHVRRYVNELSDHFADLTAEEQGAGRTRTEAERTALVRLGGMQNLANAMIEQRQFQSWSTRVPRVTFGIAPVTFLAGRLLGGVLHFVVWLEDVSSRCQHPFRWANTGPTSRL